MEFNHESSIHAINMLYLIDYFPYTFRSCRIVSAAQTAIQRTCTISNYYHIWSDLFGLSLSVCPVCRMFLVV